MIILLAIVLAYVFNGIIYSTCILFLYWWISVSKKRRNEAIDIVRKIPGKENFSESDLKIYINNLSIKTLIILSFLWPFYIKNIKI